MKKLLSLLLLLPTLLLAQPASHLTGKDVAINASGTIDICSGTGPINIATSCTGGGTQYTHKFLSTGGISTTGRFLPASGTQSAPAYGYSADTDTGWYNSSDGEIYYSSNSTNALRLTSALISPATNNGMQLGSSVLNFSDLYLGGNITLAGNTSQIKSNTSDAADNKANYLCGGGANADTRGAQVVVTGNENAAPGTVYVHSGNVSGGYNDYDARHTGGYHVFKVAAGEQWRMNNSGQLLGSGTGTIGWSVVDGTDNTACSSQCTTPAVFGFNLAAGATAPVIVGPSDATADICLCAGAS